MDKRWCEKQNAGEQGKGTYVQSFPAVGGENKNSKKLHIKQKRKNHLRKNIRKGVLGTKNRLSAVYDIAHKRLF